MIKVTWYMKKHKKTDTRIGIMDEKSKEWTDKNGNRCVCFFDIEKRNYRTAVNPIISEVA